MMKVVVSLFAITVVCLIGCEAGSEPSREPSSGVASPTEDFSLLGMVRKTDWTMGLAEALSPDDLSREVFVPQAGDEGGAKKPSRPAMPDKPDDSQNETRTTPRQLLRNAKVSLEVEDPAKGQQTIMTLVEARNGFVVSSEFSHFGDQEASPSVTISVRVSSPQFEETLAEIRQVGRRLLFETVTGQDVTEEYLDLSARIRTQQALEEQLLQIMKRAGTIPNAMDVQRELSRVRTEIESLAGRQQYLADQSALSTITVLLKTPAAVATASTRGVGDRVKKTFADGTRIALGITLFLLRAVIGLLPVWVIVVLPAGYLWKRRKALRPPPPNQTQDAET